MQTSALSGTGVTAGFLQLGHQTSRATDLSIVTAEGDKVTLSTSSLRSLGYAAASGSDGGASLEASVTQMNASDSVSLSVEGDLSHEELVDLQKVIKSFQRAAVRGDAEQFLDRLTRSDLDTIATVEGSASTETVLTATQIQATASSSSMLDDARAAAEGARPAPPPDQMPPRPPRHDQGQHRGHGHERPAPRSEDTTTAQTFFDAFAAFLAAGSASASAPVASSGQAAA